LGCCGTTSAPKVLVVGLVGTSVGVINACSKDRECCDASCKEALIGGSTGLMSGLIGWPMFPTASIVNGIATGATGGEIFGCLTGVKAQSVTGCDC
jgi:hypothetical protein